MSRSRHDYIAQLERKRLLRLERLERERQEREEVSQGVGETVSLGAERGEAFDVPKSRRGERAKPVRRLTGIDWLERQGRLKEPLLTLARLYGKRYREANEAAPLKSCLAERAAGSGPPSPEVTAALAARRAVAASRLAVMRQHLAFEPSLVQALDLICGQEMTPREATRNGAEAARLEGLLMAALGIIERSE